MKKFSWHTSIDAMWGIVFPIEFCDDFSRRFPNCGGVFFHEEGIICVLGVAHRPSMKGGHTHNHLYNVANRTIFRSKSRRKVPKNLKKEFVKTFEMNLKLNYGGSFCEFMQGFIITEVK